MRGRKARHLGWMWTSSRDQPNTWRLTETARAHGSDVSTLHELASRGLHLGSCVAFRLGKAVSHLSALYGHTYSIMWWWASDQPERVSTYGYDCGESLDLRQLFPDSWQEIRFLQFCVADPPSQHAPRAEALVRDTEASDHRGSVHTEAVISRSVHTEATSSGSGQQRELSTIPEEPSDMTSAKMVISAGFCAWGS